MNDEVMEYLLGKLKIPKGKKKNVIELPNAKKGEKKGGTHKLRNGQIHRQAFRAAPGIFVNFQCRHNCFGQRWKLYLSKFVNNGVLLDGILSRKVSCKLIIYLHNS